MFPLATAFSKALGVLLGDHPLIRVHLDEDPGFSDALLVLLLKAERRIAVQAA